MVKTANSVTAGACRCRRYYWNCCKCGTKGVTNL